MSYWEKSHLDEANSMEIWKYLGSQNVVVNVMGAMELGAWFGGFGLFSPRSLINGGRPDVATTNRHAGWLFKLSFDLGANVRKLKIIGII